MMYSIKTMSPKMFTRTLSRITDIHRSDDRMQTSASVAKCATLECSPEAEIGNNYYRLNDL
jgi:hypothetical protein